MIEINGMEPRAEKTQIIFFTIDGQEFACGNVSENITKKEDIQALLDARVDEFKLLILRKQYPETDYLRLQKDGKSELEAMEAWIAKGHKNKIQVGVAESGNPKYGYKVVEKQELEYRHPKWIRLLALIETSSVAKEIKDLLKEIVK
jgi:hypothetical protein